MAEHLEILKTFDEENLPDLDVVVLGALEFLKETPLPELDVTRFKRPLVVGSGNASIVGTLLFKDTNAYFATESSYERMLTGDAGIDGVVVISASGSKHATGIVQTTGEKGIETVLITNTEHAPAAEGLPEENILVFPKIREPYTYNVSTYLSMLLSSSHEDTAVIYEHINAHVAGDIPTTLGSYDAYFLMLPPEFDGMQSMLRTKFDELFGPMVTGRVFTSEEAKHAKTVVSSEQECFISFEEENTTLGASNTRIHIPLPQDAGPAAMMAIAYYVIGHIQKQKPPYFKDNIARYTQEASDMFGHEIRPIVE